MRTAATLTLIRHAAIDCSNNGTQLLCGSHDAALTDAGRRQVELLRPRLAAGPAAALYCSPLRRAVETARAAPPELAAGLRLLASIAEIHCGVFEGRSIAEIRAEYPELWASNEAQRDDAFRWPGGESYRQFRRRVLRAIRAIAARHPGQRVVLVTHAGVINQVLGTIAGQSAARWENFRPGNASVTEVEWLGDTGCVKFFDDRAHLRLASTPPRA